MSYSNNHKNYNMKSSWVDAPHIYRTGMFYGSERYSEVNPKVKTKNVRKKPLSIRILEYIFDVN